ncbi:GNAT family N-acetyltransferase [Salsuginibacillus kocurii]|uniref:GNAT family N-acetyltransferase n=1 Tax=Salsuginibacillus kocurii TaxID=427078 RepID=UPI00038258DF|nr:GNAT family N-acetyltransferase [Salsuginibacillus kocurii]
MHVRMAGPGDESALAELLNKIDSESEYMLYEKGERNLTAAQAGRMIEHFCEEEKLTIFVAEQAKHLVGYGLLLGEKLKKNEHRAALVLGVKQAAQGKGTGMAIMKALEDQALKNGVKRLELTTLQSNAPALHLYKKCGFKEEGVRKGSLYARGHFEDELYLGKWLEEEVTR